MIKNYLKVALRNLRRHKAYSLINIAGLAIGLACFVLIMLYVLDERSYDRHSEHADDIYRVVAEFRASEGTTRTAQSPPVWSTRLLEEFPEVVNAVRFKPPRQTWMVNYQDRKFSEKGWAFADSSVFDVFSIRLLRGNEQTALVAPYKVVISEAMASKYFEQEDPMGKTITIDNQYDFEVTGIMQDMPENTHFHFGFLASFVSMEDPTQLYLVNALEAQFPFSYTYLQLEEGFPASALEVKLPDFLERNVPEQFRQNGAEVRASLQPLTDIHLHSRLENEIEPNGDAAMVYIFFAVAVFILLIASVNFMNLATARSAQRAKEVGLRKVVGAPRSFIIQQFLGESVVLAFIGLLVGLFLVILALPTFSSLTSKVMVWTDLLNPVFLLGMIGVALAVGTLAGSYPAFYLSSFRPATVLKGELRSGAGGQTWLRKGLIIFQFGISIVLIISTGIVYNQMDYARNKKLGFDKEHIVVVQVTDPAAESRYPAFKEAILQEPKVLNVSASISTPGGLVQQVAMRPVGAPEDQSWQLNGYFSDYDFTATMGMELAAGRDFSRDFPSDTLSAILINEEAARTFGWHDPEAALGEELQFLGFNNPFRIIGVVEDFHSQSVKEEIAPTVISYNSFIFFAFVRVAPGDFAGTIETLQRHWERIVPGYAFSYSFLDDDFNKLYQSEDVLGTLLGYFALLTVFIACLGLFGLASFTAERRTKEIGVRKVLGASVPSLVLLLSREFTKLVLIAFVVAAPIAYFAMNRWLNEFAYHINIGATTFVLAGILALLIAWLTVSFQSIKAALSNPVNTLRVE